MRADTEAILTDLGFTKLSPHLDEWFSPDINDSKPIYFGTCEPKAIARQIYNRAMAVGITRTKENMRSKLELEGLI